MRLSYSRGHCLSLVLNRGLRGTAMHISSKKFTRSEEKTRLEPERSAACGTARVIPDAQPADSGQCELVVHS